MSEEANIYAALRDVWLYVVVGAIGGLVQLVRTRFRGGFWLSFGKIVVSSFCGFLTGAALHGLADLSVLQVAAISGTAGMCGGDLLEVLRRRFLTNANGAPWDGVDRRKRNTSYDGPDRRKA